MSDSPVLVWFRRDLRLADNPALHAACESGRPVIPVFIWAPTEEAPWEPGGAAKWWLHHALESLRVSLEKMGSRLVVRRGPTVEALTRLMSETGATTVYWNRLYEPAITERDARIKSWLRGSGVEASSFNAALMFEPNVVQTRLATPYTVFTPYWRACMEQPPPDAPLPVPQRISSPAHFPDSLRVEDIGLLPRIDWAEGMRSTWEVSESVALSLASKFAGNAVQEYGDERDRPDHEGTSRMSPYLHFGQIGPRQLWHLVRSRGGEDAMKSDSSQSSYLRELGWREFAHSMLHYYPGTTEKPLRSSFEAFPWRHDERAILAWQRGLTGYPIVDAGMHQLWETGWMHNRVRMVVASFLVKHLLIHWSHGARWFWDTLVDADLASNTLGWQWSAGCGADAAPYFRIFNPILQGEKFDPNGAYVRRWLPALAGLPSAWIHKPFDAPKSVLTSANVVLGSNYPLPFVEHKYGRERALAAYDFVKKPETENL
jgi:deoxyribodipyrimidine photo-lyase